MPQQPRRVVFDVAWDEDVDVAYLAPIRPDGARDVVKTVPIIDRAQQVYGTIDLSSDGTLIGIELIGARKMLPGSTGERPHPGDSDE